MNAVGYMSMPEQFRYRDVFLRGKPQHTPLDRFSIKHPPMDVGKRAKIYAPFDALKGFNEAVAAKEVAYVRRFEMTEEDKEHISRQLNVLKNLTYNSRIARQNHVEIAVTYYVPCDDVNHELFEIQGVYKSVSGVCWRVDPDIKQEILLGNRRIPFDNILNIEFLSPTIELDNISEILM